MSNWNRNNWFKALWWAPKTNHGVGNNWNRNNWFRALWWGGSAQPESPQTPDTRPPAAALLWRDAPLIQTIRGRRLDEEDALLIVAATVAAAYGATKGF